MLVGHNKANMVGKITSKLLDDSFKKNSVEGIDKIEDKNLTSKVDRQGVVEVRDINSNRFLKMNRLIHVFVTQAGSFKGGNQEQISENNPDKQKIEESSYPYQFSLNGMGKLQKQPLTTTVGGSLEMKIVGSGQAQVFVPKGEPAEIIEVGIPIKDYPYPAAFAAQLTMDRLQELLETDLRSKSKENVSSAYGFKIMGANDSQEENININLNSQKGELVNVFE